MRTLAEHDHLLRRRGHRAEIGQAKADLRSLPGRIDELEGERVRLAEATDCERVARDRAEQRGSGPTRDDADRVTRRLDADARTRGEQAAHRPSPLLIANLGPVPDEPDARDLWITAAGRIAQHHALWPIREGQILGSRPRAIGQDDYAFTHYAVERAVADLDCCIGREPIAAGRPGLGISM